MDCNRGIRPEKWFSRIVREVTGRDFQNLNEVLHRQLYSNWDSNLGHSEAISAGDRDKSRRQWERTVPTGTTSLRWQTRTCSGPPDGVQNCRSLLGRHRRSIPMTDANFLLTLATLTFCRPARTCRWCEWLRRPLRFRRFPTTSDVDLWRCDVYVDRMTRDADCHRDNLWRHTPLGRIVECMVSPVRKKNKF